MPSAEYATEYIPARRDDATREYVKEWERLADTSRVMFTCQAAARDPQTGKVTSLWSAVLPDERELFIISVKRPDGQPQYDRGAGDLGEALEFFQRFGGVGQ